MTPLTLQNSQNLLQLQQQARHHAGRVLTDALVHGTERIVHALARALGSCKPASRRAMEF